MDLSRILFFFGVGFLVANVRLLLQFVRFVRLKSSAVLIWPGRRPPFYGLLLVLGAVLSVLIVYKLMVLRLHPIRVFGEAMMLDHRYDNVRVTSIMPGSVDTEFSPRPGKREGDTSWMIAPEDIAEAVILVLRMPERTTISRVEVRPTRPKK